MTEVEEHSQAFIKSNDAQLDKAKKSLDEAKKSFDEAKKRFDKAEEKVRFCKDSLIYEAYSHFRKDESLETFKISPYLLALITSAFTERNMYSDENLKYFEEMNKFSKELEDLRTGRS